MSSTDTEKRSDNISEFQQTKQKYSVNPLTDRSTDLYRNEYIGEFVEKWDALIDWDARTQSEKSFFIDVLKSRHKHFILDAATGTGYHSVQLHMAGFEVTSSDGSANMLSKAFENARERGIILKTVQADWRWLGHSIRERYDAIICLGNSFTHMHNDLDRRRALAEFYAALKPDGILIIDQRNYDMILDRGYSSKHQFYYCGDQVTAKPVHADEELVRFQYSFPDDTSYTLNLCPIRKNYFRRLLRETGFERIRTYGDFEPVYDQNNTDFFVHVAEKSVSAPKVFVPSYIPSRRYAVTEDYYDSDDADAFYLEIWGGDDLHLGIYDETDDIRLASQTTVSKMLSLLPNLSGTDHVVDFGSGYGGSARQIVAKTGAYVTCLNLSETQNDRNRLRNTQANTEDKIQVLHADFEDVPLQNECCDVIWSQDSFLHSNAHNKIFAEAWRLLKPGGKLIFTDPMETDSAPKDALTPIYNRLSLKAMGSVKRYRTLAKLLGFHEETFIDLSDNLTKHYQAILTELTKRRDEIEESASPDFIDNALIGLEHWINGGRSGHLQWGIFVFAKP